MQELTRNQFSILSVLAESKEAQTQRDLVKATDLSLGTINRTVKELTELEFINEGVITERGTAALEPYRVKRAVFIAAGVGSRSILPSRLCAFTA